MTVFYPDLKIAAGHNNAAGLTSIETITASGDSRPFVYPQAWPRFNPGQFKVRSDQSLYIRGKAATGWQFSFLTKNQYEYLRDTYCAGDFDGNVTIRTRAGRIAYANFNARMYLPKPSEVELRLDKIGVPVPPIRFVALEAL
jgi:hypothetical protein